MSTPTNHTARFQKIYAETYEKVFHFIYRLSAKNEALTDDLVQNVYIQLWGAMDTIEEGNHLPLLYTIAKRQLIDHHRKKLTEQTHLSRYAQLQPEDAVNTIMGDLTFKAIHQGIDKVLARMPERRRAIFLLCREEGLSHREIASQMNISVDSVQQQMNLALKALQKEFRNFRQGDSSLLLMIVMLSLHEQHLLS